MRQYPIWLNINSCAYKGSKSYGIKKHGEQTIYVGSGSKNSHKFADVEMTCKERHSLSERFVSDFRDTSSVSYKPRYREFTLKVDGEVVKRMTYDMKNKVMCDNIE